MKLINELKVRLQEPLPGRDAQLRMMSTGMRKNDPAAYYRPIEGAKKACVMLLLFQKEGLWYTALMQRPESPYPHSRQISFPGGGLEDIDESLEAGALRETEEEFGIPSRDIETIGQLSQLFIPVSGYLVHPFVGYLRNPPTYKPDPAEVSEIIEVKIEDLVNPALRKKTDMKIFGGHLLKDTPYYDLSNKVVWGATAMMLSEFVEVLETIDFSFG